MITAVVVAAILFFVWRVHRSPYGRLLIAVGGNEPLARSLGKSTFRTKLGLFAVTSAGMGLLGRDGRGHGALPRYRQPRVDITLAAMAGLVLGGTARVWGAVVGVILTVGLFDIVIQSYLPLPRSGTRRRSPCCGRPCSAWP